MQQFQKKQLSFQQKTRGILWGAVLGDVIGAKLQFGSDFSKKKIDEAFQIIGGGVHKLQPGQPTDDSQLSFALGKGLSRGDGTLNLNFIAQQMANWFLSCPIDVGGTIRKSVPKACNMKEHQAYLCRKGAKEGSCQSQSNGTLMAIAPLAIWSHRMQPQQIIQAVKQYTILIHPNETVILANTFFILTTSYLINNNEKERNFNAYQFAKKNLSNRFNEQFRQWIRLIDDSFQNFQILEKVLPANKKAGWVRIAFTYSMYYLVKGTSYEGSIRKILEAKGDTDTNACIVGGLLGAYYGVTSLEMDKQIEIVSAWRPKKIKRPDWMVPGKVIQKLVLNLCAIAPLKLKIVGGTKDYPDRIKK